MNPSTKEQQSTPMSRALGSVDTDVWTLRPQEHIRKIVKDAIKRTGRSRSWLINEAIRSLEKKNAQ